MLGNIFSDKIGKHNVHYKDLIQNAFIEDSLDAPQPLDDVGDYIEYINQHTRSIQVNKIDIIFIQERYQHSLLCSLMVIHQRNLNPQSKFSRINPLYLLNQ